MISFFFGMFFECIYGKHLKGGKYAKQMHQKYRPKDAVKEISK